MLKAAIPIIRVTSSAEAKAFYCDKLGFTEAFAYRPDESKDDPCYMGAYRDDAWVHISSFEANGPTGMTLAFATEDVRALHEELVAKGVEIRLTPTDQTWGNREMYILDPDGNHLAFMQELDA